MYTHIYTSVSKLLDDSLYPQLNTHHIHMQACIHSRTKANSPRPHAHILQSCHSSSYLGIEAFDPYITTQVNVIHTIACRMDDESKNPHVSTYLAT